MRSHRDGRTPPLLSCVLAIYRGALRMYPSSFRRAFGSELLHDLQAATEDSWREAGWRGLTRLWACTAVDVVRSAVVQWTREGWPFGVLFVTPIAAAAVAASWHVYRGAWSRALMHGDEDVAIVLVAASAVLLVLVCTLVFTAVLIRPRRRARR